jgi:hypothetical protein
MEGGGADVCLVRCYDATPSLSERYVLKLQTNIISICRVLQHVDSGSRFLRNVGM